jgi:hypothetical protein
MLTSRFLKHLAELEKQSSAAITASDRTPLEIPTKMWVWQKRYPRQADFAAFGSITNQIGTTKLSPMNLAAITYDSRGLSQTHEMVPANDSHWTTFNEVYCQLAEQLVEAGYCGDFGFDGFETTTGQLFPLVDLNVRTTKTHLIAAAADRLQLQNWRALRIRWPSSKSICFDEWIKTIHPNLQLNDRGQSHAGLIMRPFSVSGMTENYNDSDLGGPREVSILCGVPDNSNVTLTQWCNTVENQILEVAHAYSI